MGIATRQVRRGERALTLCLPVTVKRTTETEDGTEEAAVLTRFVYRPHPFVLAQTDGPDLPAVPTPTWDRTRVLAALGVAEAPFDHLDGNCLGCARERSLAINPSDPGPPEGLLSTPSRSSDCPVGGESD